MQVRNTAKWPTPRLVDASPSMGWAEPYCKGKATLSFKVQPLYIIWLPGQWVWYVPQGPQVLVVPLRQWINLDMIYGKHHLKCENYNTRARITYSSCQVQWCTQNLQIPILWMWCSLSALGFGPPSWHSKGHHCTNLALLTWLCMYLRVVSRVPITWHLVVHCKRPYPGPLLIFPRYE